MAKNFPQSAAFMWWDEGDINKNGVSKFSSQTASVLTKLIDVFGDAVWNPSLDVTFAPIATPFVEVIQGRAPVGKAKTNYGPDQVGAAIYRRALTADGSTGAVAPTMYGFGEWTAITVVMSGTVEPVDTTPPSVPTGIGSSGTTSTSTTISWTASSDAESGVASYLVNRDGTDIATVTSGTAYTDTGLAPSTGYVYKVKAVNGVGLASAYSSTTSVTTLADSGDTTDPSTPTGLQAPVGQLSATQVGLTWNASTDNVGVDHYDVIRGGVVIGQSTSTAYTDTTVSPSTTYTFKVRAVDAAGNASADSTGVTVTTPASTSLPTPVGAWGFDTVV
jgi:chitodextrinase